MKAKITRKTTSEMVSPHCDNTESTTTTTKGRRRKTWEKEKKLRRKKESHCRFIEMNFFSFRLFALDFCVLLPSKPEMSESLEI